MVKEWYYLIYVLSTLKWPGISVYHCGRYKLWKYCNSANL